VVEVENVVEVVNAVEVANVVEVAVDTLVLEAHVCVVGVAIHVEQILSSAPEEAWMFILSIVVVQIVGAVEVAGGVPWIGCAAPEAWSLIGPHALARWR